VASGWFKKFKSFKPFIRRNPSAPLQNLLEILQCYGKFCRNAAPSSQNPAHADRKNSRPLLDLLESINIKGVDKDAERLGLVVTRGREIQMLAPRVWTVPDWQLFGAAD
jgi:hypothetical protein